MTTSAEEDSGVSGAPADGDSQVQQPQQRSGCLGCIGLILVLSLGLAVFNGIQSWTSQTSRPPASSTSQPGTQSGPKRSQGGSPTTPAITKSKLFGSGVVDILNAFDQGNRTTKLTICRDVSQVLSGMSSTEMQQGLDSMSNYDASVLQDLAADCNRLL